MRELNIRGEIGGVGSKGVLREDGGHQIVAPRAPFLFPFYSQGNRGPESKGLSWGEWRRKP